MKKIVLFLVCLGLALIGVAQDFTAVCESGQTLCYHILDSVNHTVEIVRPEGGWNDEIPKPAGELALPSVVNHEGQDYTVVAIGDGAFYNCENLEGDLVIPETVTRLGVAAFQGAFYKNYVNSIEGKFCLPEGLIEIDKRCFYDTHLSYSVVLPNSLQIIGEQAFGLNFREVNIPENVVSIGKNAFNTMLRKVYYNAKNCTNIGASPFGFHPERAVFIIGEQVQSIPSNLGTYKPHKVIVLGQTPPIISDQTFKYWSDSFVLVPLGCWENYHQAEHWGNLPKLYETYNGFAKEGSEWYFNTTSNQSILNGYHRMKVIGKTMMTIEGESVEVSVINHPPHGKNPQYVYEKQGVVYWYNPVLDKFGTLYDFNAGLGESWMVSVDSSNYEVMVVALQERVYDHYYYQVQWVRSTDPALDFKGKVISEVGYDKGMFPVLREETQHDTIAIDYLRCYLEGDQLCYHLGYFDCDQVYGWNGFEWYYEIVDDNGGITYQHLEYTNDTTVSGKKAKVIVRTNQIYDKGNHTEITHEYIREDDNKVYWWNKDLQMFTLLYDYSAQTGDEWEVLVGSQSITMHVDTVEYAEYDGNSYRILSVSDPDGLFSGNIICGIGHTTSFFPERLMEKSANYRVNGLRCYWIDEALVLKLGEEDCDAVYQSFHEVDENLEATFSVYPNPTDGLLCVVGLPNVGLSQNVGLPQNVGLSHCGSPTGQTEYRITNLLGQTLLTGQVETRHGTSLQATIDVSALHPGLYFITIGDQTQKFCIAIK